MMSPTQLRFLESRFIDLANERVRLKVPEDRSLLESFLLRLVEIDGGITEIEQLVEAHNHALHQLSGIDSGTTDQVLSGSDSKVYDKAAQMVKQQDNAI